MSKQSDIDAIDEELLALHRVSYQHKSWETLQRLAGVDLDRAGAALLKTVAFSQTSCRMQDVALHLGVEAPSVTRKVQELEEQGLVRRVPDMKDRRVNHVTITAEGMAQLQKLQQVRRNMLARALSNWSEEDRQTLARLLRKFAQGLHQ